jgi:hypothetical protein
MKKSKAFIFLSLALGLFFLLQFAAEVFYSRGKDKVPEKALPSLRASMKLFPFAAEYPAEAGFALLEKGARGEDSARLKASIPYFKDAIGKNPLDYQARYYLAKAYLHFSSVDNDSFDLGVAELKRAARIRGSNKQIALDCAKVFFSLWPLLEKEDQEFASDLLANVMPELSWPDFSPLVEMWSLYVQDAPLLMELLKQKPEFFGPAANQLVAAGIPLTQRHELLDLHETHSLDALERRYNELSLSGGIGLDDARSLLGQLRALKGFHRLQPGSSFSQEKSDNLQRTLLLGVISGLLTDPKAKADPRTPGQLKEYILAYITDHSGLNELDDLQNLLSEKNYFKENDFASLYLKTLIAYRKGDYGGIISDIEALRKGISFVKKEQAADYTNILLLLVDSYYSSKLLTAAEAVAGELYQNQPDNPDVLWRILRIRKILGSEGPPDKALDDKLAAVENSRFLTVARANVFYDVYLFNEPAIEIALDPALRAKLKPGQLLQVFVDGHVAYESYVQDLPEKIVIGAPFVSIESKVIVQVSII